MAINKSINTVDVSKATYDEKTTVVGQEEVPTLSVAEMQQSVEYMPRNLLAPKINELVRAVNASYSKEEADAAINAKVSEIGMGDMAKAVYDPAGAVQNAGGIPVFVNGKVSTVPKLNTFMNESQGVHVSVLTENWGQNPTDGSWRQTVTVEGVVNTMIPGVPVAYVADEDMDNFNVNIEELSRQVGLIKLIRTRNGSITFVCPEEKPTYSMGLRIPMISLRG